MFLITALSNPLLTPAKFYLVDILQQLIPGADPAQPEGLMLSLWIVSFSFSIPLPLFQQTGLGQRQRCAYTATSIRARRGRLCCCPQGSPLYPGEESCTSPGQLEHDSALATLCLTSWRLAEVVLQMFWGVLGWERQQSPRCSFSSSSAPALPEQDWKLVWPSLPNCCKLQWQPLRHPAVLKFGSWVDLDVSGFKTGHDQALLLFPLKTRDVFH